MPLYTDALGRQVTINDHPQRIISLVPSQTELLFSLGLEKEVVGITKFCVHPHQWFQTKKRVGGTKNIHIDIVRSLNPDLVIANKEENVKEDIESLENDLPVFVTDVNNLDDALSMMAQIGKITGRAEEGKNLSASIAGLFAKLPVSTSPIRTAYLIWKGPYMTVGRDSFIHDMLRVAGFENVFNDRTRYPVTTTEEIRELKPDILMLSSEPYPFSEKHLIELEDETGCKAILVDGEMFSWYGSRLLHVPDYLLKLQKQLSLIDGERTGQAFT